MRNTRSLRPNGLGMIEMMVSLALSAITMVGAYKIFSITTQRVASTTREMRSANNSLRYRDVIYRDFVRSGSNPTYDPTNGDKLNDCLFTVDGVCYGFGINPLGDQTGQDLVEIYSLRTDETPFRTPDCGPGMGGDGGGLEGGGGGGGGIGLGGDEGPLGVGSCEAAHFPSHPGDRVIYRFVDFNQKGGANDLVRINAQRDVTDPESSSTDIQTLLALDLESVKVEYFVAEGAFNCSVLLTPASRQTSGVCEPNSIEKIKLTLTHTSPRSVDVIIVNKFVSPKNGTVTADSGGGGGIGIGFGDGGGGGGGGFMGQ